MCLCVCVWWGGVFVCVLSHFHTDSDLKQLISRKINDRAEKPAAPDTTVLLPLSRGWGQIEGQIY